MIDMLSVVTIFLLILLCAFLIRYKKGNPTSNRILCAFLFINALYILIFVIHHLGILPYRNYPPMSLINQTLYVVLAQLLFFYTKSLTDPSFRLRKREAFQILTALLFLSIIISVYHLITPTVYARGWIIRYYAVIHSVLLCYIVGVFMVLRKCRGELKHYFSSSQRISHSWMFFIVLAFVGMWLVDVTMIALSYTGLATDLLRVSLTILSLVINLAFATILVYRGLKHPNIFTGIEEVSRYKPMELSSAQIKRYVERIEQIMSTVKPFLEPTLTIHDLAEKMSIPVRHLSRVINEAMHQNFFDFINRYRIEEAKRLMDEPDHKALTILAIAYEAGFNSKSAFNLVFKRVVKMTPSQYRKSASTVRNA